MSNGIRRVVTGNDAHGRSTVVIDGPATNIKQSPARPGVVINNLWMTDSMPAKTTGDDAGAKLVKLEPVANGTNFRIVEFPPEKDYIGKVSADDARQAFGEMGGAHALVGNEKLGSETPRHPFMHRTKTLDYAIVLDGEVVLVLDDGEVSMKAGDVCIQRATNHVWSNRSDKPCRIAFILIDGDGPAGH
jgi:oxalate decarboxylase/phosphoglucose isomerase-like protein (cupin superfamily)